MSTKKKSTKYYLPVNFPTMHLQDNPNMPFMTMALGGSMNFNEVTGTNYNPNIENKQMMNGLPQVGNFLDTTIDNQTTDERGIQSDFGAGASGFASGAAKGAQMGSSFGPWGIAIGAAALGTLGAVQNVKGNKKKNEAVSNDLQNYYNGLPNMLSANSYKMPDGGKIPSKMNPKQWYDYNTGMGNKPLPGYDSDISERASMTYVKFYDPKTYEVKTDTANGGNAYYTKIADPSWKWGDSNLEEPEISYDPTKISNIDNYSPYGSMVPKSLTMKEYGGELNSYNGNSHEEGGIPIGQDVEVEGGETNYKDYVFSDKLTPSDKKSTFANLSKRIQAKYKDRENDQYALRAMEQEMNSLMQKNEQARLIQEATDAHNTQLEGIKQQFANGGKKPKGFNPYDETDNSYVDYITGEGSLPDMYKTSTGFFPPLEPQRFDGSQREFETPLNNQVSDINMNLASNQNKGNNFKFGNEEAGLALSMLPALYNTAKGFKPSKTNLSTVNPNLIDLNIERQALKNEGAKARLIANENVRNIGGGSGAALSALSAQSTAINDNIMRALSGSYQTEATQNTSIRNTFADRNNQIMNQEIIANEQNQAMSDSLKSLALSDLSANTQSYLKDKKLTKENRKSNDTKMSVINQLFPNYQWGRDPESDKLMINYVNSFNNK